MPNYTVEKGALGCLNDRLGLWFGFSSLAFPFKVGQPGEVGFGEGQGHLTRKRTLHEVG